MTARAAWRGARAAAVFLTRVPVGGGPYSDDEWRWAAAYFPLVGAAVGAVVGSVDRALSPLGSLAASILAVAASMLLTGAMHEDGLADTCDALGGGHDPQRVMAILKDSRVGVFGASALVVSVAARAALVARLGTGAWGALVLAGALARTAAVWQMVKLPYVTGAAVARSTSVASAGVTQAIAATGGTAAVATTLAVLRAVAWERGAAAVVAVAGVTWVTGWRYRARVGGVTGDFLGATEQLCEIATLAAVAWGGG